MKRPQSFESAKRRRSRIVRFVKTVLLIYVSLELLSVFGIKTWVVGSTTMIPTLEPKDRVLVAPSAYSLFNPFTAKRHLLKQAERGDIVLMRLPSSSTPSWYKRMANSLLRFITLQRFGLDNNVNSAFVIKRVIATPGDIIKMEGYLLQVKAAGSKHFLTEYEVSPEAYEIYAIKPTEAWDAKLPLSGYMPEVSLGPDEYFVAGDNRLTHADSRFFGPIKSGLVEAKVLLRYWPLTKIGRP